VIDIHTHILPHFDDGPPDMETSIGMGRIAVEEGITGIISTSHSAEALDVGREEMETRLQEVRDAWRADGIGVELHLGVEIYLTPQTPADLKAGKLWSLAGSRYLLVELPFHLWPTFAEDVMFDLQLQGYTPILAHPERYTAIAHDPNRMYELAERGILSQVTGAAFLGAHGHDAQRCAQALVRYGLAQFISSDAHGVTVRKRAPRLREAMRAAARLVGEERAHALVLDNPARIVADQPIMPAPERVPPHRWSIGGLLGRD
jgi:protein-tyrosine phosphatase